ncbi:hypothetical protein GQR58_029693 [Nymphon striatum]|nr:hypothetical protein GQR58_029693 [Nymphon striatum]
MAQTVTPTMCPKRVELIHSRYQLKPILYERVYPPEYEMAHNRRFGSWVDPDCHPKAKGGQKLVELIHSKYRSKPILYERVYPRDYEMTYYRRFGPWDGSNCHPNDISASVTRTIVHDDLVRIVSHLPSQHAKQDHQHISVGCPHQYVILYMIHMERDE